jgi:hypothetical protein
MADDEVATHPKTVLAAFLQQNLGVEKATATVDDACRSLGFSEPLTRAQCLETLEHIALQPGIVGITARFAKSRAILALGTAPSRRTLTD